MVVLDRAGALPPDHWLNDPETGGGRLLGEGCHFLDLIADLAGSDPVGVLAQATRRADEPLQSAQDFSVSLRFADGSLGVLLYSTVGAPNVRKELVEAHRGRCSGRIDDFRSLRLWGDGRSRTQRSRSQDKGHLGELGAFAAVMRGDAAAPSLDTYLSSMAATFAALRSLAEGVEIPLDAVEA